MNTNKKHVGAETFFYDSLKICSVSRFNKILNFPSFLIKRISYLTLPTVILLCTWTPPRVLLMF